MTLTYDYWLDFGLGSFPQAIQTADNKFHVLYLTPDGTVEGLVTDPKLGLFENLEFSKLGRICADQNIQMPSLKRVAHQGGFGFWSADGDHKFVIFMLPTDISSALVSGSIANSVGSEVSSFSATMINMGGMLLNRTRAIVTPGTKVEVFFGLGDTEKVSLGRFYIDSGKVGYPGEKVSISARNTIGKLLKEQTFDEDVTFELPDLQQNLAAVLTLAGVEDFFVGDCSSLPWRLRFQPETTILDGINSVVAMLPGWQVAETQDGTIGIGRMDDPRFDRPGVYRFVRDETCWSYDVEFDDADAASRVCVTCQEPYNRVYAEVPLNKWWTQPNHRTLYVEAVDGATLEEITVTAEELAQSVAISGRLESFVGVFTPQLMVGDEVRIVDNQGGEETIGTATAVTHNFGRSGLSTSFTVDSGGRSAKPRLSDLIGKASKQNETKNAEIF